MFFSDLYFMPFDCVHFRLSYLKVQGFVFAVSELIYFGQQIREHFFLFAQPQVDERFLNVSQ